MTRLDKRLNAIIHDLSAEDKARLIIEDEIRTEPTLPKSERREMHGALGPKERIAYDAFIARYETLRINVLVLSHMTSPIVTSYLLRDRVLWFLRAQADMADRITLGHCSKALLTENPNLTPGRPLELNLMFGTVRLGVWGQKTRSPFPHGSQALFEPNENTEEMLTIFVERIRAEAMELKALSNYAIEEAMALRLDFMVGLIRTVIRPVVRHDATLKTLLSEPEMTERTVEDEQPVFGCVFPVDERWAVEWDEIEEDSEIASYIREDPSNWLVRVEGPTADTMLERLKRVGRLAGQD